MVVRGPRDPLPPLFSDVASSLNFALSSYVEFFDGGRLEPRCLLLYCIRRRWSTERELEGSLPVGMIGLEKGWSLKVVLMISISSSGIALSRAERAEDVSSYVGGHCMIDQRLTVQEYGWL